MFVLYLNSNNRIFFPKRLSYWKVNWIHGVIQRVAKLLAVLNTYLIYLEMACLGSKRRNCRMHYLTCWILVVLVLILYYIKVRIDIITVGSIAKHRFQRFVLCIDLSTRCLVNKKMHFFVVANMWFFVLFSCILQY